MGTDNFFVVRQVVKKQTIFLGWGSKDDWWEIDGVVVVVGFSKFKDRAESINTTKILIFIGINIKILNKHV